MGYYAYVRSVLIDHNLNFEKDWQAANPSFREARVDANGHVRADQFTSTGHLDNHFSVGPAILWAPFFGFAHIFVLAADRFGLAIPADGFSRPYRVAVGLGTAIYGFLGLWLAFDVACRYFDAKWAFFATLGIWFGTSLPVYMYFNPSWSHALSAFAVALFVWYWHRTRGARTWAQWTILGAIAGLMMDVYYPNALLLLLPLLESLARFRGFQTSVGRERAILAAQNLLFAAAVVIAFLPTLITKKIIYGSFLKFGYSEQWFWNSPALFKVCFSSEHGLFTWTPILVPAVVGLFLLYLSDHLLGLGLASVFCSYLYLIGCYQNWHGLSSFGNRFFVSLTPLFVLGLTAMLDSLGRWRHTREYAGVLAGIVVAAFVAWNVGLIFQWGTEMIPARGPVAWGEVVHNQYAIVPARITRGVDTYLFQRKAMMQQIEQQDLGRLKSQAQ